MQQFFVQENQVTGFATSLQSPIKQESPKFLFFTAHGILKIKNWEAQKERKARYRREGL